MPRAFLSHRGVDKTKVLEINEYLNKCLIHTWIDKSEMSGGTHLYNTILPAVKENEIFVAFLSEKYVESKFCIEELETAFNDDSKKVIPILMDSHKKITDQKNPIVNRILEKNLYITLDQYNTEKTAKELAHAIWTDYPVKFHPIQIVDIGVTKVQIISYENIPNVPDDFLKRLNLNMREFISVNKTDEKPIIQLPVGFSGTAINWLIAHLTIPFFNNRDVFLYNTRNKALVCAYTVDPLNVNYSIGDTFKIDI